MEMFLEILNSAAEIIMVSSTRSFDSCTRMVVKEIFDYPESIEITGEKGDYVSIDKDRLEDITYDKEEKRFELSFGTNDLPVIIFINPEKST